MPTLEMTRDELEGMIEMVVRRELRQQSQKTRLKGYVVESSRTPAEIQASIEQHRWTPPQGSPSNLELLREDRDR